MVKTQSACPPFKEFSRENKQIFNFIRILTEKRPSFCENQAFFAQNRAFFAEFRVISALVNVSSRPEAVPLPYMLIQSASPKRQCPTGPPSLARQQQGRRHGKKNVRERKFRGKSGQQASVTEKNMPEWENFATNSDSRTTSRKIIRPNKAKTFAIAITRPASRKIICPNENFL